MTTDFCALCKELADIVTAHASPDDDAVGYVAAVITRARAALASEPEPPDDGEVADPVIPGEYRGFNAVAYRNGFHAGYKHALTRAALAAGLFENITGDENDG